MENYDQIIANALQGVNPIVNSPIPPLTTGQPLIPRTMVSDAVTRAMTPGGAPPTEDDKSNALIKIGQGLLQPRMPGQSVVGNIGNAVGGGVDYLEAAKARQQNVATQQAGVGMQAMQTGAQTNMVDAQLQAMVTKYPMEVAELQEKLKTLALDGKTKEYELLKQAITSNPELVIRHANADIRKKEADASAAEAHTKFWNSYSDYLDRGGKDKVPPGGKTILHSTKSDDGSIITSYMNGSDGPYYEIVRPGISDSQQAMKIAEKELKKENSYGFFSGPTPDETKARATKLMTPQVITMNSKGEVAPPTAAKPPAKDAAMPQGQPTETPQQAQDAAGRSLKIIEAEIAQETDPEKKANLQKEADRASKIATSTTPHAEATKSTPKPAATKPGKVETWTPDRINKTLGITAGDKTGEQLDVEDAKAQLDEAMSGLRDFAKKPSRDPKVFDAMKKKVLDARAKYIEALKGASTDPLTGEE